MVHLAFLIILAMCALPADAQEVQPKYYYLICKSDIDHPNQCIDKSGKFVSVSKYVYRTGYKQYQRGPVTFTGETTWEQPLIILDSKH